LQLDATERELWEIDENLIRAELTQLERGEHLMRRKEIYEKKWPQARHHTAGAVAANEAMGNATAGSAVASFAADVGAKIGLAERTIRENIARARKIEPKLRDRVRPPPPVRTYTRRLSTPASGMVMSPLPPRPISFLAFVVVPVAFAVSAFSVPLLLSILCRVGRAQSAWPSWSDARYRLGRPRRGRAAGSIECDIARR